MKAVVGLGEAGCNIADQFAKYPQYRIYKIDAGIESFKDLVVDDLDNPNRRISHFDMPKQQSSEDYERNCPYMKAFFSDLTPDDEVLFIVGGGGNIAGASLRLMECVKDCKLSVMYIKPDLELIGGKKYMLNRISFNILQEYARSGMFERVYLAYNPAIEKAAGSVSLKDYFSKLNEVLVSAVHITNVYENTKATYKNKSETEPHVRISSYGVVDSETGKENLFFPLDNIEEKCYYIGISKEAIEDEDFFRELKENMRNKANKEGIKVSYIINESKYGYNYVYVLAHSSEIQSEDSIIDKKGTTNDEQ